MVFVSVCIVRKTEIQVKIQEFLFGKADPKEKFLRGEISCF